MRVYVFARAGGNGEAVVDYSVYVKKGLLDRLLGRTVVVDKVHEYGASDDDPCADMVARMTDKGLVPRSIEFVMGGRARVDRFSRLLYVLARRYRHVYLVFTRRLRDILIGVSPIMSLALGGGMDEDTRVDETNNP